LLARVASVLSTSHCIIAAVLEKELIAG